MTPFSFNPTLQTNFQFTPTLDGVQYSVVVNWNLFGQRYYINVSDLEGNLVACLPLIGSSGSLNLQGLTWDRGRVTAQASGVHGYTVGQTLELTMSGVSPDAYNGTFECLVTTEDEFQYDLAGFPGAVTIPGTVSYDIDLMAGYFSSTLVFRQAASQFEVQP